MTGSELLTYVKRIFKRTDKDTELYECMTDVIVDMRLRLLSDDYSYEATITSGFSAVGDYVVGVPSDFGHLLTDGVGIKDANDSYLPLRKISKEMYDDLYRENFNTTVSSRCTGVPIHYAYFGRQLFVGPAVDSTAYVLKMNYTSDGVEDIVEGTTTVPFTDKYRRIVRDGTLMFIYKMLENFSESERFEIDYERGLAKIQSNDDFNTLEFEPMTYSKY